MKINRDYVDYEHGLHIEKGTEVVYVDAVARRDGREWIEVIVMPDGKHEIVLADAVSV